MFKILDGRDRFYQWDLDRKLIVTDESIDEVHFCNRTDDCSLVCEVYQEGELRLVDVPNILLQNDWRINVYAFDGSYTKVHEVYEVERRTKPADYIYTETEIKNYDDLVARVEQIEENGISDGAVESAVERYLDEHDIKVDLTGYATEKYVDEKVGAIEIPEVPSLDGYATEKYVDEKVGAIEIPEVPSLDGYATEKYVDDAIASIPSGDGAAVEEVYVGLEAPTDPNIKLWIDVDGHNPYATETYVDEKIEQIELTPGPEGPAGKDGQDYVLTDADKAEIAGMVEVTGGGDCLLSEGTGTNSIKTPNATSAGGNYSIVLGLSSSSSGHRNAILGPYNSTSGADAFAIGSNNKAQYQNSGAIGTGLETNKTYQVVIGANNVKDSNATFIVGSGTSTKDKRNAMTVDADNVAHFPGNIKVGANDEEVATKAYINEVLGVIENGTY